MPSPSESAGNLVSLTVLAAGQALDDTAQLVSVHVTKAVNRIATARIVLLDGDMPEQTFPLSDGASLVPGTEIEIQAGYDGQTATIFKGLVVRHSVRIGGDNDSRLVLECQDKAMKMSLGRKNANHLSQTDSAIFSTILGNYGLQATVTATSVTHTELVQYNCSDWDFLLARAEANGFIVVVSDGAVAVRKPIEEGAAAVLSVAYGVDVMAFDAEIDARTQFSSVEAKGWDVSSLAVSGGTAAPQTLNSQGNLTSATLAQVGALANLRLQSGVPIETSLLTEWAKAQQVKAGLARVRGRVRFQGSSLVQPADLVTLSGVGDRFNGDAFAGAVHHEFSGGTWTTEVEFGLAPEWFAERRDLAAPGAGGLLPPIEGLQIGIVTKLDGDPDSRQRIQVKVPILEAASAEVWARLMHWHATSGSGSFFVPEIGDEVVLGYFNNDPSHPVVLGSLYSSTRAPASDYSLTAENYKKSFTTKTQLKLEFNDEKKVITVQTPAANKVVIDDDQKEILLSDQHGNTIKMSSAGIAMDSPKDITLTAKGKVTITATSNVEITATADVKVSGLNVNQEAKVGMVAKGTASAELSASGQTTVKGAIVMIN